MGFDPTSAPHLKPWLVRNLEPICDAEPGALADYILALLKHDVPESEMREELANQLEEFLEKECTPFINTLFTVLRTKTYLPYASAADSPSFAPKSLEDGIPIPLDGLLTSSSSDSQLPRKRSNTDDERDGRPAKGPRLNNDTQFSRYGNHGGDGHMGQSSGAWGHQPQFHGGMVMGMNPYGIPMNGMGMNGMNGMGQMHQPRRPQGYQPPDQKRGICRDYHNNGYCARGAMCKYSHGDDAVVPSQMYPGGPGMPFMPMFPGNGMPFMQGGYDPQESRMDMRPMPPRHHQRAPLLPRVQQEDGSRVVHPINASGELPVIQDLTPHIPTDVPPPPTEPLPSGDIDMQQPKNAQIPVNMGSEYNSMPPPNGNQYQPTNGAMEVDSNTSHMPGMRPPTLGRGGYIRGRGAIGGGRGGRGTFGGEVHNFRPEKRNDKTLVVEKIPEDKLSLDQVNVWFKRFGTVTNVAIDAMGAKALVSFSNHEEAHAAWKSEDAVFGNRFVKVFWHRPMEGHGQAGARMLAASAPLVAKTTVPSPNVAPSVVTTASGSGSSSSTAAPRKASTASGGSATISALAAKQQQLEQTIAEQKTLMASLDTATAEEKKDIMARLRKLGDEMTKLTSMSTASSSSSISTKLAEKPVDKETKERERLDMELEVHNGVDEQAGETTEDLKAKLERLKAEAASLGLDSALSTSSAPYRGGFRGRARGSPRGYFRGAQRGGPPRASMKLDNRPKKLLVKGVGEDSTEALKDWYETTGQLEGVEPAESKGAFVVSFKSRSAAEQGLAKGANIPIVGTVQISWFTGTISAASNSQATKSTPSRPSGGDVPAVGSNTASEAGRTPDTVHSHLPEEEVVASGWGGDEDDGDGMGML